MLPWPGKVELKLHLKETNASFPQELSSEWEQKERSVKVDIMANENAAAARHVAPHFVAVVVVHLTLERPTERPLPHNDNDDHRNWFSFLGCL